MASDPASLILSNVMKDLDSLVKGEQSYVVPVHKRKMFLGYPETLRIRVYTDVIDGRKVLYKRVKYHFTPAGFFWESQEIEKLLDEIEKNYGISSVWRYRKRESLVLGVNVYSSSYGEKRPAGFYNLILSKQESTSFLTFLSSCGAREIEDLFLEEYSFPILITTQGEGRKKICQFNVDALSRSSRKVSLPERPKEWNLKEAFITEKDLPTEEQLKKIKAQILGEKAKEDTLEEPKSSTKMERIIDDSLPPWASDSEEVKCQLKEDCESDPELRSLFPDVGFGKYPKRKSPVCMVCPVQAKCIEETKKRAAA